ncbi:hypothetical protein BT96DRAFT_1055658 [Gymnopus androsaceus JB14]|uniref:Uncharacterized protein n=1 Tax=Gymnopus androsaceus JB14 TaxID=1447944 RepID=A0A6A4H673_9AGAR|nr:hypothetical protein BT96DRAFT_1055658 [Gymnopus androsaceus JB14]
MRYVPDPERKRKPKIAMYQSTEDFASVAKTLIAQVLSSPDSIFPPPDSTTVRDIIISLAKYAQSIEEILARSQTSTIGASSHPDSSRQVSTSPIPDTNDLPGEYSSDECDDVNKSFKQLSVGHSSSRYFGRSSNFRQKWFFQVQIHIQTLSKLDKNPLDLMHLKRLEYWGLDIWCLQPSDFTASAHYTYPPAIYCGS